MPALAERRARPSTRRATAPTDTRQALLGAGLALLTERGYSAVGVDEILLRAGVSKGSFYHQFPHKEAFGLAVIEAYDAYFSRKLKQHTERQDLSPLARLQNFAADAEAGMARHGFRRGCLIGNLGQEMGALPESFRDALVRVFHGWQVITARCIQAAMDAREIPASDAAAWAEWFWMGWEGAVLRAKLEQRPQPLTHFMDGFLRALGAQTVELVEPFNP